MEEHRSTCQVIEMSSYHRHSVYVNCTPFAETLGPRGFIGTIVTHSFRYWADSFSAQFLASFLVSKVCVISWRLPVLASSTATRPVQRPDGGCRGSTEYGCLDPLGSSKRFHHGPGKFLLS